MLDEYFMETDPKRRKKLLDEGLEDATLEQTEKIKKLFDVRYSVDRKGIYIDNFMAQWLEMKAIAGNLDSYFSKKSNTRRALAAAHKLCLDRTDEFSEELVYRELRNLASTYVSACMTDSSYNAFILGMGKISGKRRLDKLRVDFKRIGNKVPTALGLEEKFILLTKALDDSSDLYTED